MANDALEWLDLLLLFWSLRRHRHRRLRLLLPLQHCCLERDLVHGADAHSVHDVAQLFNGCVLQHCTVDAVPVELRRVPEEVQKI
jgi:hypothetical protein